MSRIISGQWKGRKIIAPNKLKARPTTDRAKEALFNILRSHIDWEETEALDLFGGIGSIALEMASRYCKQVVCVEKDARAVAFIQTYAAQLQADNIQVIRSEVLQFLRSSFLRFDFIFADPPYDFANYAEMIAEIEHRKMLKPNGMLVIEHGQETDLQHFAGFEVMRVYGRVHFSFFRFEENP